jgi:hypothetical protein
MLAPAARAQDALQAQLDALSAAGGGTYTLPAGVIMRTITLDLPINVSLRGAGQGVTWMMPTDNFVGASMIDTSEGPVGVVRVSDLTIDARGFPIIGIWFQIVSTGSAIERVSLRNTGRSGIVLGSTAGRAIGVRVSQNTFTSCGNAALSNDKSGVSIINAIDFIVSENIIQDSAWGVTAEINAQTTELLINGLIVNNVIRSSVVSQLYWGVAVLGQPDRPARNIGVRGNQLYGGPGLPQPFLVEYGLNVDIRDNSVF